MGKIERKATKMLALLTVTVVFFCALLLATSAATGKNEVPENIYEFGKNGHYEFADSDTDSETGKNNT